MHQINSTVQAQREWIENYFQCPKEYYFVVERKRDRVREGLTSLLDFDDKKLSAQWGRLIIRPGSLAAIETGLLMLRLAFDIFCLSEVWGTVLANNVRMLAFVESLGFEQHETITISVNGETHEGFKVILTKQRWQSFDKKVIRPAHDRSQIDCNPLGERNR